MVGRRAAGPAAVAVALAAAACSPEIADGAYFCGPEELCPSGDACDGPTNSCVNKAYAEPFACPPNTDMEPDNSPAQAVALPTFTCVSTGYSTEACLAAADPGDWVSFVAPTGCISLDLAISVDFPVAFESVQLVLAGSDGTTIATGAPCPSDTPGNTANCLSMPGESGAQYFLEFQPGSDDCGGKCNFNTYTYGVALGAP